MFGIHSHVGYHDVLPGIRVKTLNYGEHMLMTEFLLAAGAVLPEHRHPYEQTGYLVTGRIRLFIGSESRELAPGDSWSIAMNVPHRADILEDSAALEIFYPVREDYLAYSEQ